MSWIEIFLAGVGLGAMIYTPLGMWLMYRMMKDEMKEMQLNGKKR